MSFTTDKQTLDDLNLIGRYKGSAIINIFDSTRTRGGRQILEAMFRYPLADAAAINRRSSTFRYFQNKELPVGKDLCDTIEDYLDAAGSAGRIATAWALLRKRLLRKIGSDTAYDMIHAGVISLIGLLRKLRDFTGSLDTDQNSPWRETLLELQQILQQPRLKAATAEPTTGSLRLSKLIRYDHCFRQTCRSGIVRIMQILYEIDVYVTVSRVAAERHFTYALALPFIEGENRIEMVDLAHPQLPGAIANSTGTDYTQNVIFLTGANMAGKSTFMKSFGIAVYLAHMGFPIAAARMTFSVQDGIYTSINVPDDLSMGYSHFYAEVLRVKHVAEEVSRSRNLVVIFDELFKGTNVKDAYDATVAVTAAFAENRNSTFIISTHITEAGETLRQQHSNMNFVYFPTIMDSDIPRYTYRLQKGISGDRHGMMIIVKEGILDILKGAPSPAT